MAQLTDIAVRNLRPKEARYTHWAGDGLGVRVTPSGQKTFIYWYRPKGSEGKKLLTLGPYPAMTVAQALRAHREAQLEHSAGSDPAEARKARKAAAKAATKAQADRPTLRSLVAALEADPVFMAKASATEVLRRIHKDILPFVPADESQALGDMPVEQVRKRHAAQCIAAVSKRGVRIGQLVAADFVRLGKYSERQGFVEDGTTPLRNFERGRSNPRDRALGIDYDTDADKAWELQRFLQRIGQCDLHPLTVLALLFILATGSRPGEVAGLAKAELRDDLSLWTLPAERRKNAWREPNPRPHLVPISGFARRLLEDAQSYNLDSPWVFPSPSDHKQHIDPNSLPRSIKRKLGTPTAKCTEPAPGTLGLEPFTPHDLRRTARSWLALLGIPDAVAERCLDHKPANQVISIYNRHTYLKERTEALELWGERLRLLTLKPS